MSPISMSVLTSVSGSNLRRAAAGHGAQSDGDLLHIRHASQVYRHGVSGEDWISGNVPCPGEDAGAATHDIATKGKRERLITSAVAAFHARFSGKGQVDIEGARAAMRLAGNCRGE